MLFNSIDFAIFLPIVFIIYWFLVNRNIRLQNLLVVVSSYVFYGWWDWRFLSLIIFSTLIDYSVGRKLKTEENQKRRDLLLWISIIVNLGFLGFFKYYNFFLDNFISSFSFFGGRITPNSLNIILPVGISFYTFQTLSYTIDVYKRKLEPTTDIIAFSAFVSFFPQLVAGPIERATNLLPQFYSKRKFDYPKAVDGMRQILWGLFKKVVVADNCAEIANYVFNNSNELGGSTLVIGAVCFTFQIYGDFSGYSDIAIGTSRLFGFNLKQNFAFPYFSRNIAEFWRRWHISLSTWFRDYLYIPLGGSKCGTWKKIRNTLIIFIVSGFWHGANWTFIIWGLLNALYFIPLLITNKNRKEINTIVGYDFMNKSYYRPPILEFARMLLTFLLCVFAWIFFRAENLNHAFQFIGSIFNQSFFMLPQKGLGVGLQLSTTFFILLVFIIVEWRGRIYHHDLERLPQVRLLRWTSYALIVFFIGMFMYTSENPFIYFQF